MNDLRASVLHLLDTTDLTDPHDIAEKLLADIDDFRKALELLLPGYVTDVMRTQLRNFSADQAGSDPHEPPVGGDSTSDAGSQTVDDAQRTVAGLGRSWKRSYRQVYDQRKAVTEGRTHTTACVRCGPSGHPAQPGTDWSAGHRHADALRIVGKEILRDLWIEAKRLHEEAALAPVGEVA